MNARRDIVGSTELILAALPSVRESWEQQHIEIAEGTIQALLDNIAKLQTLPATARRLKQLEQRAMALDAQEAGETQ